MSDEYDSDIGPQEELKRKTPEELLADKIVMHYSCFEDDTLKKTAERCAKLIISEHYKDLCYDNFKIPSYEEMKEWVLEDMRHSFDEKVMPLIEQAYPDMDDEELDAEISKLEAIYETQHEEKLESTTRAALKELKIKVRKLQKELKELKRKYVM
ncbi:MAG: hypothetical protein GY749_30510 [Desulfobacteraceae bacterium]|nr:hypothetical protein [Desulfobacteraceae bacterium]